MKKYRLFDIEWDTSDDEHPDGGDFEELKLPNEVFIEVDDDDDDFNPAVDAGDYLSDEYGFCHYGYNFEELP